MMIIYILFKFCSMIVYICTDTHKHTRTQILVTNSYKLITVSYFDALVHKK